ncbi:MAG: hypothetical protein H6822_32435 [Planctomycetaceae bacterium]|nr:hypothetical protein [Planctomycetales bacterium]MCB9926894.1 hypothetical protein [Planctomycetaceae bacterium]
MHTLTETLQQTVEDFHSGQSDWEHAVFELFDDIDQFLAAERSTRNGPMSGDITHDFASLKGLVEQQTEVLSALVNALTGQPTSQAEVDEFTPGVPSSGPEVDPFERLQQAVAAASETG